MAVVDSVRHKLAKGKASREEAKRRLREIQGVRDKAPTSESRELTVAGVIELYLAHEGKLRGEMTLEGKRHYLQYGRGAAVTGAESLRRGPGAKKRWHGGGALSGMLTVVKRHPE